MKTSSKKIAAMLSTQSAALLSAVTLLLSAASVRSDIISGRVVDAAAKPVSGVRVALAQLKLADTTGADGLFSITTPSTTLAGGPNAADPGFTLKENGLELRIARPQDVSVDLFSVAGKRVASVFRGYLPAGSKTVSLEGWQRGLAPGLYVLAVRVNGNLSYVRVGAQGSLLAMPGPASEAVLAKRASPVALDTLLLTKSAWFPKKAPIASTSTQEMGDVALVKDPIWTGSSSQDQYNSIIVSSVDKRMEASLYMIIKAMIVIESSFNAKAISMYDVQLPCGTHSYGLIQVTPGCERGYATLPASTAVTATISGGLNGNPAVLTYLNDADRVAGNTIVKENNIVIDLVSNASNSLWATSAFNPDYSIEHGAKALFDVRAEMKRKFTTCTEVQYVTMALAGYNQGSGTVSGCTALNAGGVNYSNKVLDQYRKFCTAAAITPVY